MQEPASEVASAALRALATAYASLGFPGLVDRQEPALPGELSPHQREVLSLAAASGLPLPLESVPWMTPATMERFLENGPGPLERSLVLPGAIEPDVTWRCLYRVAAYRTPAEEVSRVLDAVNDNCSAAEALALCVDLLSGAYGHPAGTGLCFPFEKLGPLLARLEADAESLEAELVGLVASAGNPEARYAELLARPLFALARRRGEVLAESLDRALMPAVYSRDRDWVRESLLSLPLARRSRWVAALRNAHTLGQYIELCDRGEVQRGVLQSMEAWPLHREQARQLLVKLFTPEELRVAIAARRDVVAGVSDPASSLLADARASMCPEFEHQLHVSRAPAALHCELHSGAGVLVLAGEVPAQPRLQDFEGLFGNTLPEVVRIQSPSMTKRWGTGCSACSPSSGCRPYTSAARASAASEASRQQVRRPQGGRELLAEHREHVGAAGQREVATQQQRRDRGAGSEIDGAGEGFGAHPAPQPMEEGLGAPTGAALELADAAAVP